MYTKVFHIIIRHGIKSGKQFMVKAASIPMLVSMWRCLEMQVHWYQLATSMHTLSTTRTMQTIISIQARQLFTLKPGPILISVWYPRQTSLCDAVPMSNHSHHSKGWHSKRSVPAFLSETHPGHGTEQYYLQYSTMRYNMLVTKEQTMLLHTIFIEHIY